ncbi:MAG TPA: MEDS domain-containing protein [Jatrophihabitans sp.]|uniref:MEDS domain-containing protein n=1 Tax=Jatrophihabitans sp. TaxID=1932789 RepID=UPI002DFE86EF|nr:MEDS domain-containing protein [Jatrophihabitans sp.]
MRTYGPIVDGISASRVHDHVAAVGRGSAELARTATQAFAAAATDDALVLCLDTAETDWDPYRAFDREITSGRLRVVDNATAYAAFGESDGAGLLRQWDAVLDQALSDGYGGIRVVADNSAVLTGTDVDFGRWLEWEQRTDRWQAQRPVVGVCWFDRSRVPEDRLAAVTRRHPASVGEVTPTWRLGHEHDDGHVTLVLSGDLDAFDAEDIALALEIELLLVPDGASIDIDVVDVGYMHHRVLWEVTSTSVADRLHLRNASPAIRRTYELLADSVRAGRL